MYKIEEVAPGAIASLKTAVLTLFADGNGDDGGNQTTDPTPDTDPTPGAAYQRKNDGEIICAYFGFRTKAIAQSWMHFFEAITSKVELRQAKRLEGCKWEIKAKGLSINLIERYTNDCDFSKSYRSEVCSSKPPGYKKPEPPQPVNPDEVAEGDIVTGLLTPSASYKIIQIMPNGILDCENLITDDRIGLRASAVTLVQKATKDTPALTAITDDLDF
jgi:hypothetical protein